MTFVSGLRQSFFDEYYNYMILQASLPMDQTNLSLTLREHPYYAPLIHTISFHSTAKFRTSLLFSNAERREITVPQCLPRC